jgi:hypothetical protein
MKLPWTYWPIMFVGMVIVVFGAALIAGLLYLNPYVAAAVGGIAYGLIETWKVARRTP